MKNYLDFRSTNEAEKWGEKSFPNLVTNEFKKTEEFQALFYYGGNMFQPINRYLRGIQDGRDELSQFKKPLMQVPNSVAKRR